MARQMCWLSSNGTNAEKVLHLRLEQNQPWQPYTTFPQYAVLDYKVPGGSKGWATYQKLMQAGWSLVPNVQAQQFSWFR